MTKLVAKEGCVFALKDHSAVYDAVVYLSDIDSPERYIELSIDEAKALREELARRLMR